MLHKEVTLKIEHFYDDEDLEFRIKSKREMLSILQGIADQGTHVVLYYGRGQTFVMSTLLGVNEHGMWLDVGPYPPENKQVLLSDRITFVSVHHHVKIQFEANDIETDLFEGDEAFYLELPEFLLRIQRRDFFRTSIPAIPPVRCIIPIQPEDPDEPVVMRAIQLLDISGGGIGLLCGEHEAVLVPEKIFPNCQITIPDVGILHVTIEVRNGLIFTSPSNSAHKRVGCHFIGLDNQTNILLQRYIVRLQSESIAKL